MEQMTTPPDATYLSSVIGNLHVLRWLHSPSLLDVQNVTREVEKIGRTLDKPLVCVAIVPGNVEPPGDDARKRMLDDLDRLLQVSESVHFVIEGSGFKHVMLRSVVTGLILVAGRRGRIFVHGSFEEALRECGDTLSMPASTILAAAKNRGLVSQPA